MLCRSRSDIAYDDIISPDNLLGAWKEFLRGKRNRKNKTYTHSRYEAFNISDPKPRNIHKASVRDRLLHHAMYRKLYPLFDAKFIFHSYSCRKNKRTHRALDAFTKMARSKSSNHTRTCWVLKCDIKKFFASIDQKILLSILEKHVADREVLWLLERIIGSFCTDSDKGLPLGNLTSQLLVNVYMNEFDQFVKHTLKAKYYIRYVDDFVVVSRNKEHLLKVLEDMKAFLENELQLEMHPKKISIHTVASGVDFLGGVHFPCHKVLRTVTKRRMIKRMQKELHSTQAIYSYRGLLMHGNTWKIRKELDLS